jgi:hypothetical protein
MKTLIVVIVLMLMSMPAFASLVCREFGGVTTCQDSQSGSNFSCTSFGGVTTCN